MLASVQREQDNLAALAVASRQEQLNQQQQQQQQTLTSLPPPSLALLLREEEQQQLHLLSQQQQVQLNVDPAFLARCRGARGPLLRAMIQEHTRRGLT